jgi:hypothetical protein
MLMTTMSEVSQPDIEVTYGDVHEVVEVAGISLDGDERHMAN